MLKGSRFCDNFLCLQFVPINGIKDGMTRKNTHIIIICGIKKQLDCYQISYLDQGRAGGIEHRIVLPPALAPLSAQSRSVSISLFRGKFLILLRIKIESQRYQNMFGTDIKYVWLPPFLAQVCGVFLGQIQASAEARTGP